MGILFDADDAIERMDVLANGLPLKPDVALDIELMAAQLAVSLAWERPDTDGVKVRNPNALLPPSFRDRVERIAPCSSVQVDTLMHGSEQIHLLNARTIAGLAFRAANNAVRVSAEYVA